MCIGVVVFGCEFIHGSMRFLVKQNKSNLNRHYNQIQYSAGSIHKHNQAVSPSATSNVNIYFINTYYNILHKWDISPTWPPLLQILSLLATGLTLFLAFFKDKQAQVKNKCNHSTQQKHTNNVLLCCRKGAHLPSWNWMSQEAVYCQRPVHKHLQISWQQQLVQDSPWTVVTFKCLQLLLSTV